MTDLDASIDYALQVAEGYLAQLAAAGRPPAGATILELGPGADLGPALLLAGAGARVIVADRFLAGWRPDWHPALYRGLLERVQERDDLAGDALRAVVDHGARGLSVERHATSVERLDLRPGSVDVCLSNAVLEHVGDLSRACRTLARITAPGGLGLHQVDFRDHRDFARPLEHLAEPPWRGRLRRWRHRGALGSTWRAADYARALREAGFAIDAYEPNLRADDAYLDELVPRLATRWRDLPREELAVLSGRFTARRDASDRARPGAARRGRG